jgi:hypothetical protein
MIVILLAFGPFCNIDSQSACQEGFQEKITEIHNPVKHNHFSTNFPLIRQNFELFFNNQ